MTGEEGSAVQADLFLGRQNGWNRKATERCGRKRKSVDSECSTWIGTVYPLSFYPVIKINLGLIPPLTSPFPIIVPTVPTVLARWKNIGEYREDRVKGVLESSSGEDRGEDGTGWN